MARSNYADKPLAECDPPEYKLFPHEFRAFTPHGGPNGEDLHGQLVLNSTGDHFWKPARDKALGTDFKTFLGVPPSPAELRAR